MSAGLPGLGLGGLFFIFSALLAPLVELRRTARGESDLASWRRVGRQFALAMAMIGAVDGTLRLAYLALDLGGLGPRSPQALPTALPLLPIGITTALLAAVLGAAKAMQIAASARSRPPLAVTGTPARNIATGAAVAAGWFALLLFGASQLSPMPPSGGDSRDGGAIARPADRGLPGSALVAGDGEARIAPVPRAEAGLPLPRPDSPVAPQGAEPPQPSVAPAEPIRDASPANPAAPAAGGPSSSAEPPAATPAEMPDSSSQGPPPHAGPPAGAGPPGQAVSGAQGPPADPGHQAVAGTRNSTRVP